jgi:hypothetical protein
LLKIRVIADYFVLRYHFIKKSERKIFGFIEKFENVSPVQRRTPPPPLLQISVVKNFQNFPKKKL